MQGLADNTRALLGAPPRERTWAEQLEDDVCGVCPSMTYKQRLIGCLACAIVGCVLEFGSFMRLLTDVTQFAIFYTFGNIVAVCGSFFLSGPRAQCKKMCDKTRRCTVFVFFVSMVLTLFLAYATWIPDRVLLIIVLVVVQSCALAWYLLSYIPFARQWITSCCASLLGQGASGT